MYDLRVTSGVDIQLFVNKKVRFKITDFKIKNGGDNLDDNSFVIDLNPGENYMIVSVVLEKDQLLSMGSNLHGTNTAGQMSMEITQFKVCKDSWLFAMSVHMAIQLCTHACKHTALALSRTFNRWFS